MANLSCASGYLTLTTATKEDLKDFIFLHVLSEKTLIMIPPLTALNFLSQPLKIMNP